MSADEWKTLRVPTDAWERAKAQKEATGRTWGEQIVRSNGDTDTDTDGGDDILPDSNTDGFGDLLMASKADVRQLKELVERVPHRTADEIEDRFR